MSGHTQHTRSSSLDSTPDDASVFHLPTPPPAAPTRKAALRRRPNDSFTHRGHRLGDADSLKALKEALDLPAPLAVARTPTPPRSPRAYISEAAGKAIREAWESDTPILR